MREPQSAIRRQEQPPVQGFVESLQCNGGHEPEWPTPEIREKGANAARSLDKWRSSSGRNHLKGVGPTPTVFLLDQFFFLRMEDVEKKWS